MRKSISTALYAGLMALLPLAVADRAQEGQPSSPSRFVAFPSFRPKFHSAEERFSLVANIYIINVSSQTLKDVTVRQPFPAELKPQLAPNSVEAQLSHPPEFWHKVEGSTYEMYEPKLLRRQPTTILAELLLERRMGTFTIPPTQIEFTTSDGPGKDQTLETILDVTDYANHVGDLDRFLRKHAGIGLDTKVSGRDEWEFAPIDAVALGKNPQGLIGEIGRAHV